MKILFVTAHAPYPTHTGSGQRSNILYRSLSRIGDVKTVTLESADAFTENELRVLKQEYNLVGTGPVTPLGRSGNWRLIHDYAPNLALSLAHNLDGSKSRFQPDCKLIEKLGISDLYDECDVIVGRYMHSLTRLGLVSTGKPTFLDVDDLTSDIYLSRLYVTNNILNRIILKRHYRNIKKQESNIFSSIDGTWVVNLEDKSVVGLEYSNFLPNIPFHDYSASIEPQPLAIGSAVVTSIAAYKHKPNLEGVQWFLDYVWPIVFKRMPDAEFHIVGSNLGEKYSDKWRTYPGVKIVGYVQDIEDAYLKSCVTICPVLRGAGTNIKVVESGAYGRNCVITTFAARGYSQNIEFAKHLCVAKDETDMAEKILVLLGDYEFNRDSALKFSEAVLNEFSYSSFEKTVKQTILQTLDRGKMSSN